MPGSLLLPGITFFYDLIGLKRTSSTSKLKSILSKYNAKKIKIETDVRAKSYEEMLKILTFDFGRFGAKFEHNKELLVGYLKKEKEMARWF